MSLMLKLSIGSSANSGCSSDCTLLTGRRWNSVHCNPGQKLPHTYTSGTARGCFEYLSEIISRHQQFYLSERKKICLE